jgi:hypothetical protein
LKFIEDNRQTGRIGNHFYVDIAGTIQNAFDFTHLRTGNLILDPIPGERRIKSLAPGVPPAAQSLGRLFFAGWLAEDVT